MTENISGILQALDISDLEQSYADLHELLYRHMFTIVPPLAEHLAMLEQARSVMHDIQARMAQRYTQHAMPPGGPGTASLKKVVALWQLASRSYAHIMRRDMTGKLVTQHALLAQRRGYYAGRVICEFFAARQQVPKNAWSSAYKAFRMADELMVANQRVQDHQNHVYNEQSPVEALITVLLVDLANPYGRTPRELHWINRCAENFAPYCAFEKLNPGKALPENQHGMYGLDIASDRGLSPLKMLDMEEGGNYYRFDTHELAKMIRELMAALKKGEKPVRLGLGDDCSVEFCASMLYSLYRPWGLGVAGRRYHRHRKPGVARIAASWKAIGMDISGRSFTQPVLEQQKKKPPSFEKDQVLLTLGEKVERVTGDKFSWQMRETVDKKSPDEGSRSFAGFSIDDDESFVSIPGVRLTGENWMVVDQSVGGFRLCRQIEGGDNAGSGAMIQHQQLIAVRPPDASRFLLGQVSWLMYYADGRQELGISVLGGLPVEVAVRMGKASSVNHEPFEQAFMLSGLPVLKTEPSLVLPSGWYVARREIELHDGRSLQHARMLKLLQRGSNFDQIIFEILPSHANAAMR